MNTDDKRISIGDLIFASGTITLILQIRHSFIIFEIIPSQNCSSIVEYTRLMNGEIFKPRGRK